MKMIRISGTFALVLLLVPLSGCIGEDDKVDTSVTGDKIEEGLPPTKFSFEPEPLGPNGTAERVRTVDKREARPGDEVTCLVFSCSDSVSWSMAYRVDGLPPLAADETIGEAWYSAWIGKPEDGQEDGYSWERIVSSESTASGGFIEGSTPQQNRYSEKYSAMLISLETVQDSRVEIRLLMATDLKDNEPSQSTFEYLDPFKSSFADAKVVEDKSGKVNLTVSALTLPETEGTYDVFLQNPETTTYLGSLEYDSGLASYMLYGQPDPKLFTQYQFFISIESSSDEASDEHGGFKMLVSRFKK